MKYYLLLPLALLLGCQKESGPTQVSGQVVDIQTGQPRAYVPVYVTKSTGSGAAGLFGSGGGGYTAQGAPYPSDGQGRFAFAFNAEARGSYALRAERFPDYLSGPEAPVSNGQANRDVRLPVYTAAWVRLQLVDAPPKGDTRSLYLSGYENNGDRLNNPHDTVLVRRGTVGFPLQLFWSITDSRGAETSHRQDVDLRPLDTVTVRVPF